MGGTLIEQYESGGAKLREAILGLSMAQAKAEPGQGQFSIEMLVLQLTACTSTEIAYMKSAIAVGEPTLELIAEVYRNEPAFAPQTIDEACTHLESMREQFASELRLLPDGALARRWSVDLAETTQQDGEEHSTAEFSNETSSLDEHLQLSVDNLNRGISEIREMRRRLEDGT